MSTDPDSHQLDLVRALRIQAHANRLANRRLQAALGNLSTAELHAPRTSFFPTIIGTLNHLLAVDRFYIAALHGDADMEAQYRRFAPHDELTPYASAQDASAREGGLVVRHDGGAVPARTTDSPARVRAAASSSIRIGLAM